MKSPFINNKKIYNLTEPTKEMILAAAQEIHRNPCESCSTIPWKKLPPGIRTSYEYEAQQILEAAFKVIK